MRPVVYVAAAITLALATSTTMAQSTADWSGAYAGVFTGKMGEPDDSGSDRFIFDTDLDGNYNDTVRTAAGADAFSPGSCSGIPSGPTRNTQCNTNDSGDEWGIRAGYDWQNGNLVFGIVGEYAVTDVTDTVTSFSTTPASYTMSRNIDDVASLRGRVGLAFGDTGSNLVYLSAGVARAKILNSYATSNAVNTFTNNGDSKTNGSQWGVGVERRLGERFSIGLEYLMMSLDDDDFQVRAAGPAPATNPFIRTNAAGTDFRRSDDQFDVDSLRLTASVRF